MPIDTSIYSNLRPVQTENPFDTYVKLESLRSLQEQRMGMAAERQALAQKTQIEAENQARNLHIAQGFSKGLQAGGGIEDQTMAYLAANEPDSVPMATEFFTKQKESAAKVKELQLKNQQVSAELNDAYSNHIGHMMENSLQYANGDPQKLQAALATNVALYKEQFPNEADRADQAYQQLTTLNPATLIQRVTALRNNAPYYQAQQQKLSGEKVAPGESVLGANGQPVYTAPIKPPNSEKASFRVDGKDVQGDYLPGASGQPGRYFYNGQDVTARAQQTPPAQLRVDMASAGQQLPAFATDAHRPSGPDANKMDPTIRMTPNGLHQAAMNLIDTGQYPPTGRGNDPIAVAQRAAINAKVGAIAADAGMDEPTLRAFYKANQGSLTTIQKSYDSAQAFMATADKNAALLESVLKKIPDVGSPLLNKPIRSISQNALGSADMATFKTYLQSVQNEYARILTQPNLAGQLSDSARHEAQTLIDPNATVAQQIASIRALNTEGGNRLQSLGEQIQRIQGRMRGGGGTPSPAPVSAPAPTPKAGVHKVGDTVIGPDGKSHKILEVSPDGTKYRLDG